MGGEVIIFSVTVALVIVAFLLQNRRYRWFYIIAKTYKRDIRFFIATYKVRKWANKYQKDTPTMSAEVWKVAKQFPTKPAIYCEGDMWTYEMLMHFGNKIARFFLQEGFKKDDVIALILDNSIEYCAIWLGLSQVGIVTALINTNLTKTALTHSLTAVNTKGVIFGTNFAGKIADVLTSFQNWKYYEYEAQGNISGTLKRCCNLQVALQEVSHEEICNKGHCKDPLLYIYTSGTTGFPKATLMTNLRCLMTNRASMSFTRFKPHYRFYTAFPMYHIAGSVHAVGHCLLAGATAVVAKKFSASNFFKDCEKYNCNAAGYIGEMCRYLLALPEDVSAPNNLKRIGGIGMRKEIWYKFVKRFGALEIFESYGATEGVLGLVNIDSHPGSCGCIPRYLLKFTHTRIIKCDASTCKPLRNKDGYCIECKINEPGLIVGKINSERTFEGYSDPDDTFQKLLKNVFQRGDAYLNSGDLMLYDELGYFYMVDRVGDNYRWKGENVSSAEVEAIISSSVQLSDVVVFGVKIRGIEGSAGMAVVNNHNKVIDITTLAAKLQPLLPSYAMPIFIREVSSVELTGTYKLTKFNLKKDGYDVRNIEDPLYFYDPKLKVYVRLTEELYDNIIGGRVRI